jgi:hypothetical protein
MLRLLGNSSSPMGERVALKLTRSLVERVSTSSEAEGCRLETSVTGSVLRAHLSMDARYVFTFT